MTEYLNTLRQFDRNIRIFYMATAVHGFVFFGIYNLLLNLYLLRLGYGPEFIGVVNGVGPLMLALSAIPSGLLSRKIGSRSGLIIGYFFVAVGFGLLPLSEFVAIDWQDTWIVGSYALAWMFGAMVIVNYGPFIMGATAEKERNYAFATQSAMFPIAGFLGNIVGGFLPATFANWINVSLESSIPYRNSLLFGAGVYLMAAVIMWFTAEVKNDVGPAQTDEQERSPFPIKPILAVATVSLLLVTGDWAIQLYLNVYLDTILAVPTSLIGTLSAGARLMGLTAFLAPLLMNRWGHRHTLLWGMVVLSLTYFPLILIGHWAAAAASFMAVTTIGAIINPTFNVFSQSIVDPQWRTTMASGVAMTTGIAIAITALGGSQIIVLRGFPALFSTGAGLILAAAVCFGIYFLRGHQSNNDTALSTPSTD